jgi:5,10-methylenetetrahydromethanopterin reductase
MPPEFERLLAARDWSLARDDVTEAGRLLSPELIRRFGLAGTPETCRARLRELLEAVPQIAQVAIVPFSARRGGVERTVRRFIGEVALEAAAWT